MSKIDLLEEQCNIQERLILSMIEDLEYFTTTKNLPYAKIRARQLLNRLKKYRTLGKDIEHVEIG